jgi:hypothetical protein
MESTTKTLTRGEKDTKENNTKSDSNEAHKQRRKYDFVISKLFYPYLLIFSCWIWMFCFAWMFFVRKASAFSFQLISLPHLSYDCRVFLSHLDTIMHIFDNHTEIFLSTNDSCMSSCFIFLSEPEQERFFSRLCVLCVFLSIFRMWKFRTKTRGLTFIDLIIQAQCSLWSFHETHTMLLVWDSISYMITCTYGTIPSSSIENRANIDAINN